MTVKFEFSRQEKTKATDLSDLVPANVSTFPNEGRYQKALICYKNGGSGYSELAPIFNQGDTMDLPTPYGIWEDCEILKTVDPRHPHWDITVVVRVKTKATLNRCMQKKP